MKARREQWEKREEEKKKVKQIPISHSIFTETEMNYSSRRWLPAIVVVLFNGRQCWGSSNVCWTQRESLQSQTRVHSSLNAEKSNATNTQPNAIGDSTLFDVENLVILISGCCSIKIFRPFLRFLWMYCVTCYDFSYSTTPIWTL